MPNDPGPAFVKINYHSSYAPHTAMIPTLAWVNTVAPGGHGEFETHSGSSVDADSMINDLVDALAGVFAATVQFDNYVIFTVPTPGADPQPRTSNSLATAGGVVTPGWDKATQATLTWRTTAFGLFKLVALDCASGGDFSKQTTVSGAVAIIDAVVTSDVQGWAGRDNAKPDTFVAQTKTLNEALRKRYRLA